jgi:predicted glycosyltransferase
MTRNPIEKAVNYVLNWIWSRDKYVLSKFNRKAIFIGEPEDIPNTNFGFLLPNRREYAKRNYNFIGYVLSFNPDISKNQTQIREELGYGTEPLVLCSIGGTSIGKDLLELCINAYPILRKDIPELHMVIVTGPRLSPDELVSQPGIELKGFVSDLYKHFAACDFAIVQGGGTSTLELTALKRQFIYFPIEGHSEQRLVSERLARYNAGIRMDYSKTTPTSLAKIVLSNYNKQKPYRAIDVNGALNTAIIINQLLENKF